MLLYHGTSTALGIRDYIYPSTETNVLRERRGKNQFRVFLTRSIASADAYADKAVAKFGGKPIILVVHKAQNLSSWHNGEFICDFAKVDGKLRGAHYNDY